MRRRTRTRDLFTLSMLSPDLKPEKMKNSSSWTSRQTRCMATTSPPGRTSHWTKTYQKSQMRRTTQHRTYIHKPTVDNWSSSTNKEMTLRSESTGYRPETILTDPTQSRMAFW